MEGGAETSRERGGGGAAVSCEVEGGVKRGEERSGGGAAVSCAAVSYKVERNRDISTKKAIQYPY